MLGKPHSTLVVHAVHEVRGVLQADAQGQFDVAATFNVPIRTVELHHQAASTLVRCGIGSGITLDATAHAEWREWQAKRAFVERASTPFDILETLRLQGGAG